MAHQDNESDERLNQQLQELIQEAQKHPASSLERRRILSRLIMAINDSNQVGHPQRGQWPPAQYEDLYNQALSYTWEYIAKNIDAYNPKFKVMAWFNDILKKRFIDVLRRESRHWGTSSMDELSEKGYQASSNDEESQLQQLRHCIEINPIYSETHIKNRPDVNFKAIFILRLDGYQWDAISEEFKLKRTTLSSFFQRNLTKFSPEIRRCLDGT